MTKSNESNPHTKRSIPKFNSKSLNLVTQYKLTRIHNQISNSNFTIQISESPYKKSPKFGFIHQTLEIKLWNSSKNWELILKTFVPLRILGEKFTISFFGLNFLLVPQSKESRTKPPKFNSEPRERKSPKLISFFRNPRKIKIQPAQGHTKSEEEKGQELRNEPCLTKTFSVVLPRSRLWRVNSRRIRSFFIPILRPSHSLGSSRPLNHTLSSFFLYFLSDFLFLSALSFAFLLRLSFLSSAFIFSFFSAKEGKSARGIRLKKIFESCYLLINPSLFST